MNVENSLEKSTTLKFWQDDIPPGFVLDQEKYLTTAGKVAWLTQKIQDLSDKIKSNELLKTSFTNDSSSSKKNDENDLVNKIKNLRMQFFNLLGQRRRLLDFLAENRSSEYQELIKYLNLSR